MGNCIYTSLNKRYLPRAMVLATGLARHQPDAWRVAVVVDELTEAERALVLTHFNEVILAKELFPKDEFRSWMFAHDVVEACTAVKGHALVLLLDRGYERVIYMDPDITLLRPMDRVLSALSEHSILLTPHVLEPEQSDGPVENERCCLSYGVYNLGFLAVRNDVNARRLARWWSERLWRFCIDDPGRGLFTDQKWFDLVPGLFDGVHVLRDPGHNVASWNLPGRRVSITDQVLVNGSCPLVFFHFTKVRGVGDLMLQRNALDWAPMKEIYEWYLRQVTAKETLCKQVNEDWAYARYSNGESIALAHRRTFRSDPRARACFQDPFQSGSGTLHEWMKEGAPSGRLARRVEAGDLLRKAASTDADTSARLREVAALRGIVEDERANGEIMDVNALLRLEGRLFLECAYATLLGRPADESGRAFYMAQLESGVEKSRIVRALALSSEGLAHKVELVGLDALLAGRPHGWRIWLKRLFRRAPGSR